LQKNY